MIVKDVLEQGYPFVEAIASVLPICDEFLVSDGYSSDGTFEILTKISSLNNKVKVFRTEWPKKKDISVLADVTNELRGKCRHDYIFSIQANEIIHEQSAPVIKALPEMLPKVDTFSFPYVQLLNSYKLTEEFRLRFSKNLSRIIAVGDAWTLGTSKAFEKNKKLRCIAKPQRFFGYVNNGIWHTYANSCYGPRSRAFYLPKPIFRYWALFPTDFLAKYERHSELFLSSNFKQNLNDLKGKVHSPETFWKMGSESLKETRFKEKPEYPEGYNSIDRSEHPALTKPFISNPNFEKYYVREEIFEIIKTL